jgi:hypothetical protein
VNNIAENAENFAHAGRRYCSTVDSAPKYERSEFLLEIYRVLPVLIGEAMGLPIAELPETSGESEEPSSRMPQEAWAELYGSLKQKLDDLTHTGRSLILQAMKPNQFMGLWQMTSPTFTATCKRDYYSEMQNRLAGKRSFSIGG